MGWFLRSDQLTNLGISGWWTTNQPWTSKLSYVAQGSRVVALFEGIGNPHMVTRGFSTSGLSLSIYWWIKNLMSLYHHIITILSPYYHHKPYFTEATKPQLSHLCGLRHVIPSCLLFFSMILVTFREEKMFWCKKPTKCVLDCLGVLRRKLWTSMAYQTHIY